MAALIPNLLNGASSFDNLLAGVLPGSAALINFMSSGCALINSRIKAMGYATPVAATSELYDLLADIEASYAAYRAEQVRGSPRIAPGERTRAEVFRRAFDDGLKDLAMMDLSRLGITHTSKWAIPGISVAEKESVESDTDRVAPRFSREQFKNPDRETSSAS